MKLFPVLVGASLVANAVLVGALVRGAFSESSSPRPIVAPKTETASAASPAETAAGAWQELQAEDLAAQIARLRAEDFPPSIIRAIATAQIRERFAARRKALEAAAGEQPFWIAQRDPKWQAEQRALAKEEQNALRELLGPDPENGTAAQLQRALPFLSSDKIDQLALIQERYNDQRSDFYANVRGAMLPEEQKKYREFDQAMFAEFASVLTPQEMEELNLRMSRTATSLRYRLAAFDATEQEYRTLYRLQSDFDERVGQLQPGMSQEQTRARSQGQRELNAQIEAALGPARYPEYQRAIDTNYQRTTQVVARLGLDRAVANDLHALQQSTQQRLTDMRTSGLPIAERAAQGAALAQEAEAKIRATLGDAGFDAYKQYAGSWLNNLTPRPPPAKK